jgi:hypothetical protein
MASQVARGTSAFLHVASDASDASESTDSVIQTRQSVSRQKSPSERQTDPTSVVSNFVFSHSVDINLSYQITFKSQ